MSAAAYDSPGPTGFLFNVMRFATHDGPGIRTTVFFKGCPLRCRWCHNPESQSFLPDRLYFEERCRRCLDCIAACPERAIDEINGVPHTSDACAFCGRCAEVCMAEARQIAGRRYSIGELMAEIEKDLVFFDDSSGGVTLSGGEPVAQPAFVAAVLKECGARRIRTAIETCGFAKPAIFGAVAALADLVLFDVKIVDAEKHRRHTGTTNELILGNLEELVRSGRAVTVRIPVVPGINDAEEEIEAFAKYLGRVRPRAVELLPYHPIGAEKYRRLGRRYELAETPHPSAAGLAQFRDVLSQAGLHVTVGGES